MDLSLPTGLEIVIPVLVFVFVSLQRWKTGMHTTWRDIAEAQEKRATLLEKQVADLTAEVQALRRENAELRGLLAAHDTITP